MAKTMFQGLICERLELPGVRYEETKGQNVNKAQMQGLTCKKRVLGWGFNFTKAQGLKRKKKDLVGIIFELRWTAG